MNSHTDIDRISPPCMEVFVEKYLAPSRPVIISGIMGACPATSWTPDYLRSVVGNKSIKVASSSNGTFNYSSAGAEFQQREMDFGSALALIEGANSTTKYYIMQKSIHMDFPELVPDLTVPSLVPMSELLVANLWLGSAGNVTPLHFDRSNNFLSQIYGRKLIRILSPSQTEYLYHASGWSEYSHISSIDPEKPDRSRFPLVDKATWTEFMLEPGETLFVPCFWWHHVRSVDLSISVNFWWKGYVQQFFAPNSLSCIPEMFDRNRLAGLGPGVVGGLMALARHAHRVARIQWMATLCAAAAFDQHTRQLLRKRGVDDQEIPGRLDTLYSGLVRLANQPSPNLDAKTIAGWMRLVVAARSGNDRDLSMYAVELMISGVQQFIDGAPL